METYWISTIRCCLPCEEPITIYSCGNDEENKPEYYGVLKDYVDRDLTMEEADDLIAKMIKRHPIMDNVMELDIHFELDDGEYVEFYHMLNFVNRNYKDSNRLTPIRYAF